ncbi:MAG TPA: 50S ribosomal protein L11 methyltransferase [Planctomycetota bacterium]|nr:50S ribosomal protein L11 methyltransferase [Planctomycetota bacterium]
MLSLPLHIRLLDDIRRTRAFDRALAGTVRPGDVVADLGCGSGILSLLALKHGAARVYAVDRTGVVELARLLARENGVEDRMVVLRGRSYDVRLPERVDVVVSEILGHLPFEEDVVGVLADARRRFLKPGGRMIPASVRMMGAPALQAGPRRWRYGVQLETLRALAGHEPALLDRVRTTGQARTLWGGDPSRSRLPIRVGASWRVPKADGVAAWFDARLSPSVRLSSRRGTHWRPVFFPAREALRGRMGFDLEIARPEEATWRFNAMAPQSSVLAEAALARPAGLTEDAFPRLSPDRLREARALAQMDGRRTVRDIARGLGGLSYAEALRKIEALCRDEGVAWNGPSK